MNCRVVFSFLLICVITLSLKAQELTPPPEFTIGAFVGDKYVPAIYDTFKNSDMNTMVQYADEFNHSLLSGINVIASNASGPEEGDWIQYYASGYYSKWEAEENQTDKNRTGVKHRAGIQAEWLGKQCWSSIGITSPEDSLMYGPHYRQERRYKRWEYGSSSKPKYTPRFRMALAYNPQLVNPNEHVCVIKVVHRYSIKYSSDPYDYIVTEAVYREDTLRVSDFNSDGSFVDIYFDELDGNWYEYPPEFTPEDSDGKIINTSDQENYPLYIDSDGDNGIQFWVDWIRDDTLATLYIDYAEVYDNDGWNYYIDDPDIVKDSIQAYAQSYSGWDNIIYWYGQDEPWTLDAFTPMHIVDSLVRDVGGAPLITSFYPYWTSTNTINGDTLIRKFYEIAQPEKLMINVYPFTPDLSEEAKGFERLHQRFQEAYSLQPGFFVTLQTWGWKDPNTGRYYRYQHPSPEHR
ncbi:MAG: hypothetical protein Kow0098_21430 [Ignavibacteriaceae bacterium]